MWVPGNAPWFRLSKLFLPGFPTQCSCRGQGTRSRARSGEGWWNKEVLEVDKSPWRAEWALAEAARPPLTTDGTCRVIELLRPSACSWSASTNAPLRRTLWWRGGARRGDTEEGGGACDGQGVEGEGCGGGRGGDTYFRARSSAPATPRPDRSSPLGRSDAATLGGPGPCCTLFVNLS